MKNLTKLLILPTFLLISACNEDPQVSTEISQSETPVSKIALKHINSCTDLKQKFIANWVENLLSSQRYSYLDDTILLAPSSIEANGVLASPVADSASVSTPDNVSQTNVQEEGVDEADTVKTDSLGNMFIAQHDKLVIADAFPPQTMNILSTLALGGTVTGIYLSEDDNRIAALTRPNIPINIPASTGDTIFAPYIRWIPKTVLILIDISDLSNPVITKKIRFDGSLISSRRIGSRLHLVQGYYLNPFTKRFDVDIQSSLQKYNTAYLEGNTDEMENIKSILTREVTENLGIDEIEKLLPRITFIDETITQQDQLLTCDDFYSPDIDLQQNHLLMVSSLDLLGENIQQLAALGSGWVTYASQDDLFIVQPSYQWWWKKDQHQQSAIHHFSINELKPAYVSTGMVKGFINDSYSMSYFQDHLRVTATQDFWNRADRSDTQSTNHLFVLKDNDSNGMDIIGSVQGFAKNERIYSSRFLGDKGFVVTFRVVDPLFSFDLTNPEKPSIAGELKIPGFSTYMHPIDDTHLLTIGRDGVGGGNLNQVAVKLFDISDLSTPKLIDTYMPDLGDGYSWSGAAWDPHAFTYYASERLLAIPLSSYDSAKDNFFTGIISINVDPQQGLSLAGKVDHKDLVQQISCDSTNNPDCTKYYYRWLSRPTRSVFMSKDNDTYLYSLSNIGLKANNTDDFQTTLGSLLLPSPEDYYGYIY